MKSFMRARLFRYFVRTFLVLSILFVYHEKFYMAPGPHLEIEGLVKGHNFRDVGASVNSCIETLNTEKRKSPLKEGVIFRSNKWFSGWSCDNVNNPDHIYTLNYRPEKQHLYYCKDKHGNKNIGKIFSNEKEIKDIEFLSSWSDPVLREVTCSAVGFIYLNTIKKEKSLFHCEAGRDRTGAVAAIITAASLEQAGFEVSDIESIIECDYRKSKSIGENKYGRMQNFYKEVAGLYPNTKDPMTTFLKDTCGVNKDAVFSFVRKNKY